MRLSAVNFVKKIWSKSFNNGIAYNTVGFTCISGTISRKYSELFYKLFTRATESGRSFWKGGCKFWKKTYHQCFKMSRRESVWFLTRIIQTHQNFRFMESGLFPFVTDIVEAKNNLIIERYRHIGNSIKVKVSRRTQKVEIYLANEGSGLAFFTTDLGHNFGSNVDNEFGVMLRGRRPQKPEFGHDIVRIHSLIIYTDLVEYNIIGDTKIVLLRCSLLISKLKNGDILTTGQYINYQTL